VSKIAEETGIYRPTIYRNIPNLIKKSLISKINIKKRTYYIAEDPEKLKILLNDIQFNLNKTLPEISNLYLSNQKRPAISWHEGKKAISDIYETIINTSKKGDCIYRYESPREAGIVSKYYPKLYFTKTTSENGNIEKYVITNEITAKRRHPKIWRHTKYIPESFDSFDYNISQLIYKDTVVFIDYDTETATVIKNQRFADFQLKIFKMFFNRLENRGN
jgi:sugar-specific transcriptional regulator TrmB